jgi:hypothetical protein
MPWTALLQGIGMMLVAVVAAWYWRQRSGVLARWFWLGAGLWTVAVLAKVVIALFSNPAVISFLKGELALDLDNLQSLFSNPPVISILKDHLSFLPFIVAGGLYLGIESSLCEIGLTWLAVLRWRELGRDSGRAIAIGVGSGAFEAFLLGLAALAGVLAAMAGVPGTEGSVEEITKLSATTPLWWLLGPVERVTAIICHASSRALVLLGTRYGRGGMVALGFLIFTLLDGAAGAAILSGVVTEGALWWFELAISVFAIISLPILRWCHEWFADSGEALSGMPPGDLMSEDLGAS